MCLFKIWGMQVVCLIVVQMLFWNRYNQDSARRVYFNISREKPAHMPDTLHVHPLSCKSKWTDQKHFYCFFAETNQRQSCSRVPHSSSLLAVMRRRALGSRIASKCIIKVETMGNCGYFV